MGLYTNGIVEMMCIAIQRTGWRSRWIMCVTQAKISYVVEIMRYTEWSMCAKQDTGLLG